MALAEIQELHPSFAALAADGRSGEHQNPVDPKISQGERVCALDPLTLEDVEQRVVQAVLSLSQTRAERPDGECLAYAFLDKDEEAALDTVLVDTVKTLIPNEVPTDALWAGTDHTHAYQLTKAAGFIIMQDGAMPAGVLYHLFGSVKPRVTSR